MTPNSNEPTQTPEYFLVIGQEDGSQSVICEKSQLVETVLGLAWTDSKDASEEERAHWQESIAERDNWSRDESYFHEELGEIGHIYIHRIDNAEVFERRCAALQAENEKLAKERDELKSRTYVQSLGLKAWREFMAYAFDEPLDKLPDGAGIAERIRELRAQLTASEAAREQLREALAKWLAIKWDSYGDLLAASVLDVQELQLTAIKALETPATDYAKLSTKGGDEKCAAHVERPLEATLLAQSTDSKQASNVADESPIPSSGDTCNFLRAERDDLAAKLKVAQADVERVDCLADKCSNLSVNQDGFTLYDVDGIEHVGNSLREAIDSMKGAE